MMPRCAWGRGVAGLRPSIRAADGRLVFGRHLLLGVLVLTCGLSSARSAEPLSELVGADVGLYVELTELDAAIPQLVEGRFFARLQQNALFRRWQRGREYQKLQEAGRAISEAAQMPAERLLRELFGDAVAIAVYRRDGRDPVGILIGRAVNDAALDRALQVWRTLDRRTRMVREHRGVGYVQWQASETDAEPPQFFVRFGPLFGLSDSEWAVQRLIELQLQANGALEGPPLATLRESSEYTAALADLAPDRLLHVFLNPAVWQSEFPERMSLLRACQTLVADVRLDAALTVQAVARFDREPFPGWDAAVPPPGQLGRFLDRVPARVLLAGVGGQNWKALSDRLAQQLRGQRDAQVLRQLLAGLLLQTDPLTGVLGRLSPDWGLCIVPRDRGLPGVWLGLARGDAGADDAASFQAAWDNALQTGLKMAQAFAHATPGLGAANLESESQGGATRRWLSGLPFLQPGYAVSSELLVLGTDPDVLRTAVGEPTESLLERPEFQAIRETYVGGANQLVYVDLEQLRAAVQDQFGAIVGWLARSERLERDVARDRLQRLAELFELCDRLYLGADVRTRRVRVVLGGWCGEQ